MSILVQDPVRVAQQSADVQELGLVVALPLVIGPLVVNAVIVHRRLPRQLFKPGGVFE